MAGSDVTRWVRLYRQDQEDISGTGVTPAEGGSRKPLIEEESAPADVV